MANETVVIEIVARGKNEVDAGFKEAQKAIENLLKMQEKLNKMNPSVRVSTSSSQASSSLNRVQQQADRLNGTNARIGISVRDNASAVLSSIWSGVKNVSGKTFSFAVKLLDYATSPLRGILNYATSLKGIITTIIAGATTKKLLINPMMSYQEMEKANIGFGTQLGTQGGQDFMQQVRDFAIKTPFKTSNTISLSRMMMNAGWNTNEILGNGNTRGDLERIGDLATAYGYGDAEMESMIRAFAQIRSKGVLSAEEMTRQLGEKIPAWKFLAVGLGYADNINNVTDEIMRKVKNMAEKKMIGAEEGIRAMMKAFDAYAGTMDKVARDTIPGIKSMLEDTFSEKIWRRWGEGLNTGAKPAFKALLAFVEKNESKVKSWGDALNKLGESVGGLLTPVEQYIERVAGRIDGLLSDVNFDKASIGGKFRMVLDAVFTQEFMPWWESRKGHLTDKLANLAGAIGKGLGNFYATAIKFIFGFSDSEPADIGGKLGRSFAQGFADAFANFDFKKVILGGIKRMLDDALKLLPGGKEATNTSLLNAGLLAMGASKLGLLPLLGLSAKGLFGIGKWGLGKLLGIATAGATQTAGVAGGTGLISALTSTIGSIKYSASALSQLPGLLAINMGAGNLAGGASLGVGALSALGIGGVAGGVLGATTFISGIRELKDAYENNSTSKKIGGWAKTIGTVAGVAVGAKVGASIGAIGGPLGMAIGAGAGALLGKGIDYISKNFFLNANERIEKNNEKYKGMADEIYNSLNQTRTIDNMLDRYDELRDKLNDTTLDMDTRLEAERKMGDIVKELAQIYPNLISEYETMHGLTKNQVDTLRELNEQERRRNRIEAEKLYEEWRQDNFGTNYGIQYNTTTASLDESERQKNAYKDALDYLDSIKGDWNRYSEIMRTNDIGSEAYNRAKAKRDELSNYMRSQTENNPYFIKIMPYLEAGNFEDLYGAVYRSYVDALNDASKYAQEQGTIIAGYEQGYLAVKTLAEDKYLNGQSIDTVVAKLEEMEDQSKQNTDEYINLKDSLVKALEEIDRFNKAFGEIETSKTVNINVKTKYTYEGQVRDADRMLRETTTLGTQGYAPQAIGDIITQPTRVLMGEAGPEAIIPLSGAKRNRGIELWEKAGEMMGIKKSSIEEPKATTALKPYATGDIVSQPTRALVGEAGPEAIIPLSSAKRNRGLNLWEKAGKLLGIKDRKYTSDSVANVAEKTSKAKEYRFANGGIVGKINDKSSIEETILNKDNTKNIVNSRIIDFASKVSRIKEPIMSYNEENEVIPYQIKAKDSSIWDKAKETLNNSLPADIPVAVSKPVASGSNTITVNLGGVSFDVNVSGNGDIVSEVKKAIPQLTDEICKQIANALSDTYSNMTVGGVA